MKQKLFLFIIILFTTVRAFADSFAPEADTFLWRISKANQPTSYLIGTMHIAPKHTVLPQHFQAALLQSKQILMESRQDEDNPQAILQTLRLMRDNKTLGENIGVARVQKMRELITGSGIEEILPMINKDSHIAPWLVWYYSEFALTPHYFSGDAGIDSQLEKLAQSQHIPVNSLERNEPIFLMQTIPNDVITRSLDIRFQHADIARGEMEKSWRWYAAGQARKIWAHDMSDEAFRYAATPQDVPFLKDFLNDKLLRQRNQNWLPTIKQTLPKQSTTIAVGGLHLFGEYGLIRLLRQAGYTVEPVLPN